MRALQHNPEIGHEAALLLYQYLRVLFFYGLACWKEVMKRMKTMKPKQPQQQQQHFFWHRATGKAKSC